MVMQCHHAGAGGGIRAQSFYNPRLGQAHPCLRSNLRGAYQFTRYRAVFILFSHRPFASRFLTNRQQPPARGCGMINANQVLRVFRITPIIFGSGDFTDKAGFKIDIVLLAGVYPTEHKIANFQRRVARFGNKMNPQIGVRITLCDTRPDIARGINRVT